MGDCTYLFGGMQDYVSASWRGHAQMGPCTRDAWLENGGFCTPEERALMLDKYNQLRVKLGARATQSSEVRAVQCGG